MIRLRTLIQRSARSMLIAGALALVCLAVAWAHGAPAAHDMTASGGDQMAEAVSICLAVLQVGAGLLVVALGAAILRRSSRPPRLIATVGSVVRVGRPLPPVAARAEPAALQVLRC